MAKTIEVKGKYNTIEMVDPNECYFIVEYADGNIIRGKNLIDTGWADLKPGIAKLYYHLSNYKLIIIPKFESYLHLVEVSQNLENGNKIYHSVNIKGILNDEVINYKIFLKQSTTSDHKIGDILVSKDKKIIQSPYWKAGA